MSNAFKRLVSTQPELSRILGNSPSMHALRDDICRVAKEPGPVLVTGESGTGKALIAAAIHAITHRSGPEPHVLNCAGLHDPVQAQSQLFGHTRDAFTGATRERPGAFREAKGGTLVLDEFGDLPAVAQGLLLRALDARRILPLGADREVPVDVRLVVSTHRDLAAMVEADQFRHDLFSRFDALRVRAPALREHPQDIPLLVQAFLDEDPRNRGLKVASEVIEALQLHPFPGNVRELHNAVVRMASRARGGGIVRVEHLELRSLRVGTRGTEASPTVLDFAGMNLRDIKREVVARTLRLHRGDKKATARALDISPATVGRLAPPKS